MLPRYSNPRLVFPKGKQRKFLLRVFKSSKLNAESLSKIVAISARTIRDWKREKYHITKNAVDVFCNKFALPIPPRQDYYIQCWWNLKKEIGHKGGIAYFNMYGIPGSKESKQRGGRNGLAKLRALGKVPPIKIFKKPPKSQKLAEFVGIMLGDGSIGPMQISITLNRIADADYLKYVRGLCRQLFGEPPKTIERKTCLADDLYYCGINLVKYLTTIGMKIGNKVKQQVGVPEWIFENREYKKFCCRGLIDTDGCISCHKYYVNNKLYKYNNLIFTNHSIPLAEFVYNTLLGFGFHPKIVRIFEKRRVWLYNSSEVDRYLRIIGSSNQRLLRYRVDGQNGYARVR